MKQQATLVSVPFMVLGTVFCVCLVAANLLETKVIQLFGPFSATAGLLVFPISYILNDCIAEVWGFRKARLIIWLGFGMNFMVVLLSQLAVALPAAPFWEGEEGFNFVFGLAPRIAAASLTAFLAGSFVNKERKISPPPPYRIVNNKAIATPHFNSDRTATRRLEKSCAPT